MIDTTYIWLPGITILICVLIVLGFKKYYSRKINQKDDELNERIVELSKLKESQEQMDKKLIRISRQLDDSKRKLENLENEDPLTGASNQKAFDQELEVEWKRAERSQQPLSLILADIDYFKLYTDSYGHLARDNSLLKIANILQQSAKRPGDLIARVNNDVFAVMLPDTTEEGVKTVAEKIRQQIEAMAIPHKYSPQDPFLTISCGTATMIPNAVFRMERLYKKAKEALISAKENGRNRIWG
jgi:diguanylate cyclase (GGDEF)-like protein